MPNRGNTNKPEDIDTNTTPEEGLQVHHTSDSDQVIDDHNFNSIDSTDKQKEGNEQKEMLSAENINTENSSPDNEISLEEENFLEKENSLEEESSFEKENSAETESSLEKENSAETENSSEGETSSEKEKFSEDESPSDKKKKKKINGYKILQIIFTIAFVVFTSLFLYEVWLQPYLADKAADKARSLYQPPQPTPVEQTTPTPTMNPNNPVPTDEPAEVEPTPTPDPTRDSMGRLLEFAPLLEMNPDVKGWLKLLNLNGENDTKIDYVVMQSGEDDPEYYLTRDWLGNKVKAGSLFLDIRSSVEKNSQNLVIHGHNMTSSDDMFHYLLRYNKKSFYDSHPIIDFNTIYSNGQWKVFGVFITNGAASEKEPLFDFTIADFDTPSDFLNFIYQIRIRSIYNADDIDIREDDQILMLSTCSYEVKDYRTVIVARKVRAGEDPVVNTDNVFVNPTPLYPYSYYYRYGGKAPKLPETFEEALEQGMINWYTAPEDRDISQDQVDSTIVDDESETDSDSD